MQPIQLDPNDTYDCILRIVDIINTEVRRIPTVYDVRSIVNNETDNTEIDAEILIFSRDFNNFKIQIIYKSMTIPSKLKYALEYNKIISTNIDKSYRIFGAPKISESVGAILEDNGYGYVDLAGNMLLITRNLYIHIQGKTVILTKAIKRSDMFKRSSMKTRYILRKLLEDTSRIWLLRDLAEESKVSLGLISKVLKQLLEQEYIIHTEKGYSINKPQQLIKDWAEEFNIKNSSKTEYYSMDTISEIEGKIREFAISKNIYYGFTGFSGAARIAPSVRYKKVHFYINEYLEELAIYANWKKVDSGSNIAAYRIIDSQLLEMTITVKDVKIVPSSQLLLDLLGLQNRGEEAANAVFREVYPSES